MQRVRSVQDLGALGVHSKHIHINRSDVPPGSKCVFGFRLIQENAHNRASSSSSYTAVAIDGVSDGDTSDSQESVLLQIGKEFVYGKSEAEIASILAQYKDEASLEVVVGQKRDVDQAVHLLTPSHATTSREEEIDMHDGVQRRKARSDRTSELRRKFDPEFDWRTVGKSETYIEERALDTTPGGPVKEDFRPLDRLDPFLDWHDPSKQAEIPSDFLPDTDPTPGIAGQHEFRTFNGRTTVVDDAETTTIEKLAADTDPVGSTVLYHSRNLTGKTSMTVLYVML